MAWVKLDDHVDEHPKVAATSDSAFRLWVNALAYANRSESDGFVPAAMLRRLSTAAKPDKDAAELVRLALWEKCDGGYQIHDYFDYQPSKESADSKREKTALRVAAWRERNKANAPSNAVTNDVNNPGVTPAPVPVPVPVPDLESVVASRFEKNEQGLGEQGLGESSTARATGAVGDPEEFSVLDFEETTISNFAIEVESADLAEFESDGETAERNECWGKSTEGSNAPPQIAPPPSPQDESTDAPYPEDPVWETWTDDRDAPLPPPVIEPDPLAKVIALEAATGDERSDYFDGRPDPAVGKLYAERRWDRVPMGAPQ